MGQTEPSFEQIYDSTKQSVLRYIASKCINICDIQDIYQETYARVFEALSQGKQIKDAQAFAIGTAKHCLAHYYTAMQRLRARVSLSSRGSDDELDEISSGEDIELAVINKDLLDSIFSEICSQSADVQKMFYLHYFMDIPLDETAKILKMNENTVRQGLYRAVRLIRRKYTRRKEDD